MIDAIFIQSFHKEMLLNTFQIFIKNFVTKVDINKYPVFIFLNKESKVVIEKMKLTFLNNWFNLVYIDDNEYGNPISTTFYNMMNYGVDKYKKVLLLESDCILKDNFIEIINKDLEHQDFLIYGSYYYGELRRIKKHLNGVSVYNRNKLFLDLIQQVFIKENWINKKMNYDLIFSQRLIKLGYTDLLLDSKYIINLSHRNDCNIDYTEIKPDSVIIHQKYGETVKHNRLTVKNVYNISTNKSDKKNTIQDLKNYYKM